MSEFPQPNAIDAAMPESINTGDVKTDTFNAGPQFHSTVADTVNNFFDDEDRRVSARRFAEETDACDVSEAREEELKALYVGHAALIDSLVADLARERVLFLTGERGIGKQTTALYVATLVAEAHNLDHSTALIAPLDAQVHLELRNVAVPEFQRRVIVFDDALANRNASLLETFGKLERAACERLVSDLLGNGDYLIITVASADLAPFHQQLSSHLLVRELNGQLPAPLVEDGYARKVEWIRERRKDKAGHLEQLTIGRAHIVDKLKTLAAIASFIDFYIRRGDPDLESALDDYTDGGRWFRTSLAADFDAWCCALALVLAQAMPPELAGEIAWLDFERLRRAISDRLKGDAELFPPWRDKERARTKRSGESLDDDALRAVAQIEATSNRSGHTVRFIEPVSVDILWRTLLTHHRRILNAAIPTLRTLAEQERAIERLMLRVIAARAIGRIGEIDPDRMIRPLVRHWGGSPTNGHLVGRLLQGVLGSANPEYRETAWQHIAGLVAEGGDNAEHRLVSAIAAYAQAAAYDAGRAMECLGEIVIEQLSPAMDDHHQAARAAAIADRTAADARTKRRSEVLRRRREGLMRLAGAIKEKYKAALAATGKAVAYIAYDDPIGTLTAMRDWTSKGGQEAGVAVARLFLEVIAYDLVPEDVISSPFLLSLSTGGKEAVSELAAFLADVYTSIHRTFALPADTQHELQSELTDCLTCWARAGVDSHIYCSAVEDLFVALAAVRGCLMREEIYTLLGSSVFVDDEDMCSFAIAVRKRLDN